MIKNLLISALFLLTPALVGASGGGDANLDSALIDLYNFPDFDVKYFGVLFKSKLVISG